MPARLSTMIARARLDLAFLAAAGLMLATGAGCGTGRGDLSWIGPDAALVRCTVAGPNRIMPPLLGELPHPHPPSGMFVRAFDPVALTDLGYQRDTVVCAALIAPAPETLARAEEDLESLRRIRADASAGVAELGSCACDAAARAGRKLLVEGCADAATDHGCRLRDGDTLAVRRALEPLEQALAATDLPFIHWRVFGVADRSGWFVDRFDKLVGRYEGGAKLFARGDPVPEDGGHALLRKLIEEPNVVAVVREEGGLAHLVVRELSGGRLVFDHFRYDIEDLEVRQMLDLVAADDLDLYRRALAPPAQSIRLELDPRGGPLIMMDRAMLERVDVALSIHARFDGHGYDLAGEQRSVPEVLLDRVELQLPFGHAGEKLEGRFRLSASGAGWMQRVRGIPSPLSTGALLLDPRPPSFTPSRDAPAYLLRGTPVDHVWFSGVHGFPQLLEALEQAHPGQVSGAADALVVPLQAGPLPIELGTRDGLKDLRERLSKRAHELRVTEDEGWLSVVLEPR